MFLKNCLLSSFFVSNLPETFALHLSIFEDGAHYDFNDKYITFFFFFFFFFFAPGRVAQSVGHLTRKSGVLGSIPGLATYFRFSFRFFKKGSCQLLAKVCARSTG